MENLEKQINELELRRTRQRLHIVRQVLIGLYEQKEQDEFCEVYTIIDEVIEDYQEERKNLTLKIQEIKNR